MVTPLNVGEKITLKIEKMRGDNNLFKGRVIYSNTRIFTLRNNLGIKECFTYNDLDIGLISIITND